MGDEWPYAPPYKYDQAAILYYLSTVPGVTPDVNIFAAIAMAESGGDASVINNTPATEDYSVGLWQINYFGNLYAGRAAQFGTPQQLVLGRIAPQTKAAIEVWKEQGYGAWSTYNSGAYLAFYDKQVATGPPQAPGQQTAPLQAPIGQGIDAWDGQVKGTADLIQQYSVISLKYSRLIDAV